MDQEQHTKRRLLAMLAISLAVHMLAFLAASPWLLSPQTPNIRRKPILQVQLLRPKTRRITPTTNTPKLPSPPKHTKPQRTTPPKPRKRRSKRQKRNKRVRKKPKKQKQKRPAPAPQTTRIEPTPTKAPPTKRQRQTRKSYKHLDLTPRLASRRAGKKTRNGKGQAWAGTDSFSRTMQGYHRKWQDFIRDRSGLTDMFFGKATVALDRCLEVWFKENTMKYLKKRKLIMGENQQALVGNLWQGIFQFTWDRKGRGSVRLLSSKGSGHLDTVAKRSAAKCIQRVTIPKRLQGKRLQMKMLSKTQVSVNLSLSKIVGLREERNPQTGGIRWVFTHIGKSHVSSHSMTLSSRITP